MIIIKLSAQPVAGKSLKVHFKEGLRGRSYLHVTYSDSFGRRGLLRVDLCVLNCSCAILAINIYIYIYIYIYFCVCAVHGVK